jgi:hypothetical protein
MDRYPVTDDTQPELELWEPEGVERTSFERTSFERTRAAHAGTRIKGRMARSLPGAAAASLIVAAIAFGAVLRPSEPPPQGAGSDRADRIGQTTDAGAPDGDGKDGESAGKIDDGYVHEGKPAEEVDEPTDSPDKPKPTEPTEPKPTEPTEPTVESIELALHLKDGYVKVDWTACETEAFRYYKVVRSHDERPTWPLGEGDKLIAAVEDAGNTVLADGGLPLGTKLFYRVFALADRDAGPAIACQSPVRGVAIPAPTPKPDPEPEPTDKPSTSLAVNLSIKEGKPYIDWSECSGDFDYYKVVRSTDATVTWPKGDNDSVVAAVGPDGKTAAWDGEATPGKKLWYRVFCVRETDDGYKVVASSAAKAISVPGEKPKPEPEPDPVALGFEVDLADAGVKLHWEGCSSDSFVYYKVVRSQGSNPSYLPGTDGSQVIAVIENPGVTSFTDGDVEAGQTWYYRVQAIGYMNGHKILLGQTAAIAVTVE